MTQREHLQEILRLANEHPDYPIYFLVDSNEIVDARYTKHEIYKVKIEEWHPIIGGELVNRHLLVRLQP